MFLSFWTQGLHSSESFQCIRIQTVAFIPIQYEQLHLGSLQGRAQTHTWTTRAQQTHITTWPVLHLALRPANPKMMFWCIANYWEDKREEGATSEIQNSEPDVWQKQKKHSALNKIQVEGKIYF